MFKLKYEHTINFAEKSLIMIRATIGCIFLVIAGQFIVFFYDYTMGRIQHIGKGLLHDCILPSLCYIALWIVLSLFSKLFIAKNMPTQLVYSNLTCLCLIIFAIIHFHYTNNVIYALLTFPMFASLLFIDKKPLLFAFMLTLGFYLIYSIFIINFRVEAALANQSFTEIVSNIILQAGAYILSRVILKSLSILVHSIMTKDDEIKRDSFTGLFNHSSFNEKLDEFIMRNHRTKQPFSLIIWDIDDFKSINDTFGHDMGDKVLMLFTKALNECIGTEDLAFRYGGEEFTLLTSQHISYALTLSNRVRERFTQHSVVLPLGKVVTASAGLCEYDRAFGGSREFFSAADRALYTAKKNKR